MRGAGDRGTTLALGVGGLVGGGRVRGWGLSLVLWEGKEAGRRGGLGAAAVGEEGHAPHGTDDISSFLGKRKIKPCC